MARRVYTSEKNRPYKRGIVKEVDPKRARARVEFEDEDGNISFWLNVNQMAASKRKSYWMPDVGSQVNCLVDWDGEDGCILGALYSEADPPPVTDPDKVHQVFEDGAIIEYDQGTHTLTAKLPAGSTANIEATTVVLKSNDINLGGLGGKPVARISDKTSDGATIVTGSSVVKAVD